MKAIILAGGLGTRLFPSTLAISKHLIPVYDKPMIYYPLTTLMLTGLRDILVITTPDQRPLYQKLLGDGSQWGINLTYAKQDLPGGIAQAFVVGEEFIGDESVCLMLGDNILFSDDIMNVLQETAQHNDGATLFSYYVNDPERYGVVTFDEHNRPIEIVEKPKNPQSNYALIGLYFYDNQVIDIAKGLKPSVRGELEITDISREYLRRDQISVVKLGRGTAWLDTGMPGPLLEAANFIEVMENRQGLKIGCPEEVAWQMGYIDADQLRDLAKPLMKSGYGEYLLRRLSS